MQPPLSVGSTSCGLGITSLTVGPGQEPVWAPRAGCQCPYPANDPQALVHLKYFLKKRV